MRCMPIGSGHRVGDSQYLSTLVDPSYLSLYLPQGPVSKSSSLQVSVLTIDITNILPAWNSTANPAGLRNFRYKIGRLLDISGNRRNQRIENIELLLSYSTAFRTHTYLFRLLENALNIRVAASTTHERN